MRVTGQSVTRSRFAHTIQVSKQTPESASPPLWVILLALLAQIVYFAAISRNRIIDSDEGLYLLASRLVTEHKLPYLDFFYQQMPGLPLVYGLWMKVFGISWSTGRLFSAILAAIVGAGLFAAVWREAKTCVAGAFALALFVTHADVLGWYVTVKTYALSALLLFAAHQFVAATHWRYSTILGGIALGLATDVRLYFVALLPVFVVWLYQERRAWPEPLRFASGFVLALIPNVFFVVLNPQAFFFDNLGFHAIRTGQPGLIQDWPQKLRILSGWVTNCQILVVLLLACLFGLLYRAGGIAARLALYLSLVFAAVCLLPSPAFTQYLCPVLPVLIFAAVTAAGDALRRLPYGMRSRMVILYFVIFLLSSPIWWRYYDQYFQGLAGMSTENWRVQRAIAVSRAVDEYANPGELVVSTWSGYVFESKAVPFPGTENECRLVSAEQLSAPELRKYHIAAERQIAAAIERGAVRIVIFGHQPSPPGVTPEEGYYNLLRPAGFRVARRLGDTEIFVHN